MITAKIIADSINPKDCRLTSWVLEYPRFVHAELMTHRVFSKNSASSRAIPIETMIKQIQDNPAMPEWWGKNQSGMQAKEELSDVCREQWFDIYDDPFEHRPVLKSEASPCGAYEQVSHFVSDIEYAQYLWLKARDCAIGYAKDLNKLGLHKQITNRILEPWFHIRVILTGTEFDNWFALRSHPDAQPEIRVLAEKMLELYNASEPKSLAPGSWHIPFGDNIDEDKLLPLININDVSKGVTADPSVYKEEIKKKIAIARCARVSYLNFEGKDDYAADIKLCDRLFANNPKHLSPTEHVAQSLNSDQFIGNFRGWKQYRKFFSDESLTDSRVIKKSYKK